MRAQLKILLVITICLTACIASAALAGEAETESYKFGWVEAMAINGDGVVFAGSRDFTCPGVWRSLDSGKTWNLKDNGIEGYPIYCIAIKNNGTVFAGSIYGTVFRSTDNGENWNLLPLGAGSHVVALAIDDYDFNIYAGTEADGVYHSTNNGDSWTQKNNGLLTTNIKCLTVDHNRTVFAGTWGGDYYNGGIFRLYNSGTTWQQVNDGLGYGHYYLRALGVNEDDVLFASCDYSETAYASYDGGNSWTLLDLQPDYCVTAFAFGLDGMMYAATQGSGVFYSGDAGKRWTPINDGLNHMNVKSLAAWSSMDIVAGTYDGGIYKSGGGRLGWVANGLSGKSVSSFVAYDVTLVFAGASDGVYRSPCNGGNWVQVNQGLTNTQVLSMAINGSKTLYAGTNGGGVFTSSDKGDNWASLNTGLTDLYVEALTIDDNEWIFAGTYSGIFRYKASQGSWSLVLSGVDVIEFTISKSGYIFAGTYSDGVYRSTDGGDNWAAVNTGLFPMAGIKSLAADDDGNVFAGDWMLGYAYRMNENDNSWTKIDNGMSGISSGVSDMLVNSAGYLFAAQYHPYDYDTIYASGENGDTWTPINRGLPYYYQILTLGMDFKGNLFAGAEQSGIYRIQTAFTPWQQTGLPYPIICCETPGDANDDGGCNVGDAVFIINFIFKQPSPQPPCYSQADANNSGGVEVGDAVYIVDYIFKQGDPPVCGSASNKMVSGPDIEMDRTPVKATLSSYFDGEKTIVRLESEGNLYAIDLDITCTDPALVTNLVGKMPMYACENNGGVKVGMVDLAGNEHLSAGRTALLEVAGDVTIADALGVNRDGYVFDLTVVNDNGLIPREFILYNNHPNPFNPITSFDFSLPVATNVRLEVFNIAGQKVATVAEGFFEAGRHSVSWDAGSSASGVYLYHIEAGQFVDSKKMILLK